MRRSLRRYGAVGAVLALVAATLVVLLATSPAPAAAQTQACTNSAVPTDFTQLDSTLVGSAPATLAPGQQFTLSGLQMGLALPGDLFVAGYNLGLLQAGVNNIPGNIKTTIEGTNTVEGTQTTPQTTISLTTTITDPDATPGNGNESATPATVTVNYPDQTWTAGPPGGQISFREDTIQPLGPNTGAIVANAMIGPGGFLSVNFRCSPGTVTGVAPNEVITFQDPAASFATSTISSPTSTAPASTAPASTAPASTAPASTAPTSTAPTSTAPTSTAPTSPGPTSPGPTSPAPTRTAPPTTAPKPSAPSPPMPVGAQPIFTG